MATVSFRLNRPIDANGKEKTTAVSILVQLYISKDLKPEVATGETVIPKYWKGSRVTSRGKDYDRINDNLDRIQTDLRQLWRDNIADLSKVRDLMPAVVRGDNAKKKHLFPILWRFITEYRKDKNHKTAKKYEALYCIRPDKETGELKECGHLFDFDPNLNIDELDLDFCEAFKDHLYNKGFLDSTVFKYLSNLKTFLAWADQRGYSVHHTKEKPTHTLWEIIERVNEPISLNRDELEKLESLVITNALIEKKLPPQKHGRRGDRSVEAFTIARDYLIMECRTCQRISDIKSFSPNDMEGMTWVNRVTKGQRLTGKVVRVPFNTVFTAPAYTILQKYASKLPKISEKTLNENIKTVCMLAGIDKQTTQIKWKRNQKIEITGPKHQFITTHTGRKTFITIALQFLQPKLVKDIAGISWQTLKHYEGQTEDQTLINALNSIPEHGTLMRKSV